MNNTTEVATPVAAEVTDMTSLRPADVCDSHLMARAAVRIELPSGFQLLFCGHCYTKHEGTLALKGATVLEDIRSTIK